MAYVLYGARGSGSGMVEAACAELGVPVELHDLDARGGEHHGDAYAAMNPQRKMPMLVIDGDEVLTESAAILLTLDERHREGGLLPPLGSAERAQALRWMIVLAAEFYPIVEIMDHPERFAPSPEHVEGVREQARKLWQRRWQTVEDNAAGAPYFLRSGFSLVDLYIAVLSRWDLDPKWRETNLPRIETINAATRARPALAAVFERHSPRV